MNFTDATGSATLTTPTPTHTPTPTPNAPSKPASGYMNIPEYGFIVATILAAIQFIDIF
jgi:hypothetical protein